jgi:hypothetical protein
MIKDLLTSIGVELIMDVMTSFQPFDSVLSDSFTHRSKHVEILIGDITISSVKIKVHSLYKIYAIHLEQEVGTKACRRGPQFVPVNRQIELIVPEPCLNRILVFFREVRFLLYDL